MCWGEIGKAPNAQQQLEFETYGYDKKGLLEWNIGI
jgi:hypothetical protein